jgi:hypothetical protein
MRGPARRRRWPATRREPSPRWRAHSRRRAGACRRRRIGPGGALPDPVSEGSRLRGRRGTWTWISRGPHRRTPSSMRPVAWRCTSKPNPARGAAGPSLAADEQRPQRVWRAADAWSRGNGARRVQPPPGKRREVAERFRTALEAPPPRSTAGQELSRSPSTRAAARHGRSPRVPASDKLATYPMPCFSSAEIGDETRRARSGCAHHHVLRPRASRFEWPASGRRVCSSEHPPAVRDRDELGHGARRIEGRHGLGAVSR